MPVCTLETSPRLLAQLWALQREVFTAHTVLYPGCGIDTSPSEVFEQVTYVDINPGCIDQLQRAGFSAFNQDIREYRPDRLHDLLILMNPQFRPDHATPHLVTGGYIVANNYHGSARWLFEHPGQFAFVAGLGNPETDTNGAVSVALHAEGYFEPVRDEAELIRLRPRSYQAIREEMSATFGVYRQEPTGAFEQDYQHTCILLHRPVRFPAKRVADSYVFQKR